MTGQVKEEVLSRFGELGVRVQNGTVRIEPGLLRPVEFSAEPHSFRYLDVNGEWQQLELPAASLAFTWCQVPVVYRLDETARPSLSLTYEYGKTEKLAALSLPESESAELFLRSGRIRQITVTLRSESLYRV